MYVRGGSGCDCEARWDWGSMGIGKPLGNTLQFAQTHAPPHPVDEHRYSSIAEAAVAPAGRSLVASRSGARVAGLGGAPWHAPP